MMNHSFSPPRVTKENVINISDYDIDPEADLTYRSSPSAAPRSMAARSQRPLDKPSPRPLPKPSADDNDDLDPFQGRRLRRSPPPGVLPRIAPQEPQLPPPPTQKGLSPSSAMSESPTGIHNTPSKRARTSKSFPEPVKSSPLKQPPLRPQDPESSPANSNTRQPPASQPAAPDTSPEEGDTAEQRAHPARAVPEYDPNASKKAMRDSLLADIKQLRSDMRILSLENMRVREYQEAGKLVPRPSPEDSARLHDILRRDSLSSPESLPKSSATDDWLETALNPMAFLPFAKPDSALKPPPMFTHDADADENQQKPVSHHPIPMTSIEELPFLRVFTPLTLASKWSFLPRTEGTDTGPLMQHHAISVASSTPGLFAAKIDMTVNTETLHVTQLSVPSLDSNAVGELGPFIDERMKCNKDSALAHDVSVVTWAMSDWVRLASRRARFWCRAERELGTQQGIEVCVRKLKKGNKRRGRKGGRIPANDADQAEDSGEDDLGLDRKGGSRLSRADLLPHLGRTGLDLDLNLSGQEEAEGEEKQSPLIRIQWRIEFDWTGEGHDKLSLLVEAPPKWHGKDNRGSLAGIPAMFDKLVSGCEDPLDAVKAVVVLLVGETR